MFFQCVRELLGMLQRPVGSDRVNIEASLKICVCLTNLKIENSPIHADEPIYAPQPEYGGGEGKNNLEIAKKSNHLKPVAQVKTNE